MKRKVKRFLPLFVILMLIGATNVMGTTVYYINLDLPVENSAYSSLRKKETTSNKAYVARTTPAGTTTSVRVRVVNSEGYQKSSDKKVTGIATVYPSYSGYNVEQGDYVKLFMKNNATDNKGQRLTGTLAWYP